MVSRVRVSGGKNPRVENFEVSPSVQGSSPLKNKNRLMSNSQMSKAVRIDFVNWVLGRMYGWMPRDGHEKYRDRLLA